MPTYRQCANCGVSKPASSAKYCTSPACQAMGRENIRQSTILRNKNRWRGYKERGIDPTHGGEAAMKRGAKIALSNRENPRRKKRTL